MQHPLLTLWCHSDLEMRECPLKVVWTGASQISTTINHAKFDICHIYNVKKKTPKIKVCDMASSFIQWFKLAHYSDSQCDLLGSIQSPWLEIKLDGVNHAFISSTPPLVPIGGKKVTNKAHTQILLQYMPPYTSFPHILNQYIKHKCNHTLWW